MDDLISRQAAIDALRKLREEDIEDYGCEIPEGFNQDHLDRATFAIKQLPSAQQIPWDRKTRNSMVGTLQMLRRLSYNIHGVMDVIDDDNVRRLIEWLEGENDVHNN